MTMAPVHRSQISNYPYDEEWRNAIMTTTSWRPATTIRRSPATGLHQLERKAGRMLERSRRSGRQGKMPSFPAARNKVAGQRDAIQSFVCEARVGRAESQ